MSNAGSELDTARAKVAEIDAPETDPDQAAAGSQVGERAEQREPGSEPGNQQLDAPADGSPPETAPAGEQLVVEQPTSERPDAVSTDELPSTEQSDGEQSEGSAPSAAADLSRPELSEPDTLRAAIESVLFISDAPVTVTALAAGLHRPEPEIEAALAALAQALDERGSGIELREIGEGVRLYSRPELAGWIESFLMDGQRVRLTQAALETLSVIAYRQPITRSRISAIRGVNVDGVVRTLITRGLITEVGADPDTGGGLYRTTELFLEKMGLRSLDELPSLAPLLPELSGLESDELSG
ncbi:MAG TPA: SMC-Scp complex subunit ScpB [Jatrophihabitantaceae bacterium]|nr:SMC-Scp complex subunit ScpB [Jatrophihabitantaceae bacterium]